MKRFLFSAAALTMIVYPAVAQTWVYSGKPPKGEPTPTQPAHPTANDVFWCGKYVGSDPDVNVRLQLLKDYVKKDCGS